MEPASSLLSASIQLDLFASVLSAYSGTTADLPNTDLYERIGSACGIDSAAWDERTPIGRSGEQHSPLRRKVRWYQQTLKSLGLLERGERRGLWRLTALGKKKLTPAPARRVLLGYSTNLGLALWGSSEDVFGSLDEPISLILTSPPYPLAVPRLYGNTSESEYVDWLCGLLEPIVKKLMPGGSIALNISNDIFETKSPARSLYGERLSIALRDRLGLWKMDLLIWLNASKAPGPIQWASLERSQLHVAWEPILWFTNDPKRVRSCNQRVLQEHNERHVKLMQAGGEKRVGAYGDGANRMRHGAFGNQTAGKIPRNVLQFGHRCADQRPSRDFARAHGIATHGAAMPLALAKFLVEFLTLEDDLVVDPFLGIGTSGRAAELTNRRWAGAERAGEYVLSGAQRFKDCDGFEIFGSIA